MLKSFYVQIDLLFLNNIETGLAFPGNQSVIAGVCIFDTISYLSLVIFWFELQLANLCGTREIYKIERYSVKEC